MAVGRLQSAGPFSKLCTLTQEWAWQLKWNVTCQQNPQESRCSCQQTTKSPQHCTQLYNFGHMIPFFISVQHLLDWRHHSVCSTFSRKAFCSPFQPMFFESTIRIWDGNITTLIAKRSLQHTCIIFWRDKVSQGLMTQETTRFGSKDKGSVQNGSKRVCNPPPPPYLIDSVELDSNQKKSLLLRLHMHCTRTFLPTPICEITFTKATGRPLTHSRSLQK